MTVSKKRSSSAHAKAPYTPCSSPDYLSVSESDINTTQSTEYHEESITDEEELDCADVRIFTDKDFMPTEKDLPLQIGQGARNMCVELGPGKVSLYVRRFLSRKDMRYRNPGKGFGGVEDLYLSRETCEKLVENETVIIEHAQKAELGKGENFMLDVGNSYHIYTEDPTVTLAPHSPVTQIRKMLQVRGTAAGPPVHTKDGLTFRFSEIAALLQVVRAALKFLLPI